MQLWSNLISAGLDPEMDIRFSKKIKITNQISLVLAFIAFCYVFLFSFLGYITEGLWLLTGVASLLLCVFFNAKKWYLSSRLLCFATVVVAVYTYAWIFGKDTGIQFVFFPCICLPWIYFDIKETKYIVSLTAISVVSYFSYYLSSGIPLIPISPVVEKYICCSISFTVFVYIYICMRFLTVQNNKAEQFLADAYQNFFEDIPTPMWIFDEHTMRFLAVNQKAIESYGYNKEEFLSMNITDICSTEEIAGNKSALQNETVNYRSLDAGYILHRKKNGALFYAHILTNSTQYNGLKARVVQAIDVNDKVVTERHLEELKISQEKLKIQGEELIKSNKELDSFVYSVSHDLRAPLSSMHGIIDICESETNDATVLEYMGMLKTCISKLDGFIIDILDYSKNARIGINRDEINFKELLDEVADNLKFMGDATQRQVDIRIKINQGNTFYTDKRRLSIILNNLISNAIRYQNEKIPDPFVEIIVNVADNVAGISIKDNGIGIPQQYQEKIFDMFFRLSLNSLGSGLGLYIVKETIAKINGNIEVKSEIGKGSEFSIYLPDLKCYS